MSRRGRGGSLAKLAVKPSLEVRLAHTQLQETFQLQAMSELAARVADVGRRYNEHVGVVGRCNGLGSPHLYATVEVFKLMGRHSPLLKMCVCVCTHPCEAESINLYRATAPTKRKHAYDETRAMLTIGPALHPDLRLQGMETMGLLLVAQVRTQLGEAIVAQVGGAQLFEPIRVELERGGQAKVGKKRWEGAPAPAPAPPAGCPMLPARVVGTKIRRRESRGEQAT